MKQVFRELLKSKKFFALMVGLLTVLLMYPLSRFLGLSEAEAQEIALPIGTKIVALVGAYLAGQGLADFGKEKVKLDEHVYQKVIDGLANTSSSE